MADDFNSTSSRFASEVVDHGEFTQDWFTNRIESLELVVGPLDERRPGAGDRLVRRALDVLLPVAPVRGAADLRRHLRGEPRLAVRRRARGSRRRSTGTSSSSTPRACASSSAIRDASCSTSRARVRASTSSTSTARTAGSTSSSTPPCPGRCSRWACRRLRRLRVGAAGRRSAVAPGAGDRRVREPRVGARRGRLSRPASRAAKGFGRTLSPSSCRYANIEQRSLRKQRTTRP